MWWYHPISFSPPPPITNIKSQRQQAKANDSQHRPMTATQANEKSTTQCRSMKANEPTAARAQRCDLVWGQVCSHSFTQISYMTFCQVLTHLLCTSGGRAMTMGGLGHVTSQAPGMFFYILFWFYWRLSGFYLQVYVYVNANIPPFMPPNPFTPPNHDPHSPYCQSMPSLYELLPGSYPPT